MRRFVDARDGATAVEFALVSPILILVILFVLQVCIGVQRWTALQAVSDATARCRAIAAPACSTASAATTHAMQLASARGIPGMVANMVSVTNSTIGGVALENVTIAYTLNVAGFTANLYAVGSFPIP